MSALASLVRAYDRLAERSEAPAFGYSTEKIGFLISLNEDGTTAGPPIDLREGEGKKRTPRLMPVPQPYEANLWHRAQSSYGTRPSYVLGVTAGEGQADELRNTPLSSRTHKEQLRDSNDAGLRLCFAFIEILASRGFREPRLARRNEGPKYRLRAGKRAAEAHRYPRPASRARAVGAARARKATKSRSRLSHHRRAWRRLRGCIPRSRAYGARSRRAPRSFPSIIDAFTSYGHEQGDNAPVSEAAAFAYTTALNQFLERDSGHRVQIGDASTVFWADASDAAAAAEAEGIFAALLGADRRETSRRKRSASILEKIRARPADRGCRSPNCRKACAFTCSASSPNAARLSVRFYHRGRFRRDRRAAISRMSSACASIRRRGDECAIDLAAADRDGGAAQDRRTSRPISPASGCARFSPARPIR